MALPFRTGFGFDVHRLVEGRDLWIGGVKIEHSLGIDSKKLLRCVADLLREKGYTFGNADITICAEAPKMNPHIPAMQKAMAECIGCDPDDISVKATTTERLGFTGRQEGISAYATVLIARN